MTSLPSPNQQRHPKNQNPKNQDPAPSDKQVSILWAALILLGLAWMVGRYSPTQYLEPSGAGNWVDYPEPLVMRGGDPHIRALMRTISAAESNIDEPYRVIYGGQLVENLDRHPDLCIEIVTGPNTGDCTTAAGRYQFLTTTWEDKAERYHPQPPGWIGIWRDYSFKPEFQDAVVYGWLSDTTAWGVDIAAMLREGRLGEVLYMLSGTWTSLGYGIETNSMSPYLPQLYQQILQEELQNTGQSPPFPNGRS